MTFPNLNPCKCGEGYDLWTAENCQMLTIVGCHTCQAQATYGIWQAGLAKTSVPRKPNTHKFDSFQEGK